MAEGRQFPSKYTLQLETVNKYGIWTGGADMKEMTSVNATPERRRRSRDHGRADMKEMTSVNATSIVGGLRFWADALLRAEGRQSCTGQARCTNAENACPTCALFGCTGISRAFNMQVSLPPSSTPRKFTKGQIKIILRHPSREDSQYYLTKGYIGALTLQLTMRRPHRGEFSLPTEAMTALFLMLQYGTVGAYDQYGCGLVRIKDNKEEQTLRDLCKTYRPQDGLPDKGGVTLRDFFFFKGKVSSAEAKTMCEIRYQIRNKIRPCGNALREWFCGTSGKNPCGTNYNFSISPKSGELYGWGHFARNGIEREYIEKREEVITAVHACMQEACTTDFQWKEFCAPERDPSSQKDWPSYLTSLISTPWRTV